MRITEEHRRRVQQLMREQFILQGNLGALEKEYEALVEAGKDIPAMAMLLKDATEKLADLKAKQLIIYGAMDAALDMETCCGD